MKNSKISVIIPVYNAEKYLEKAIHSALQFDLVKEVILIEDGSPDDVLAICKEVSTTVSNVFLYQHPKGENRGAAASRNLGMEKATSEYISFLDADDYYLPNRFDRETKEWELGNNFDGMYSAIGVQFYTEASKDNFCKKFKVNLASAEKHLTTLKTGILSENLFLALNNVKGHYSKGYFHLNGFTIKRKSIEQYKLEFVEHLRLHQDTVFIYQCAYWLDLLEGDLFHAVSMRGIHDENRITVANPIKQLENRLLMFQELYNWAMEFKIDTVILYYFYQVNYNQIKLGNNWNKWKIYFRLVFSKRQFFKKEEARIIHSNLIKNKTVQRIYTAIYVRINRKLAKK